jgi:hemolysin activation/secretion protein
LFAAGRWQATAFVESARTRINRDAWIRGENRATLSGAGVGLAWDGPDQWRASLSLATPIGGESPLVASQASARAWLVANKAF